MEPITYITSLLTFYLKGKITQEQNLVKFEKPNAIFFELIPLGKKTETLPINQIASVSSDFKLRLSRLIVGIIVALFSFSLFAGGGGGIIGGLIVLLIGVSIILDAFDTYLVVTQTSGVQITIPFFVFEKNKAELAERRLNEFISNRLDDTNVRQNTDRIVDAINNK